MKAVDKDQASSSNEAVDKLRKLVSDKLKFFPEKPSRMQLIAHTELCSILWMLDYSGEIITEFVNVFGMYERGMLDLREIVNKKGTREQIIDRLDALRKEVGFEREVGK